jgi:hypothetical protein
VPNAAGRRTTYVANAAAAVYPYAYAYAIRNRLLTELQAAKPKAPSRSALVGIRHPQYVTIDALFHDLAASYSPPVFKPFQHGIVKTHAGVSEVDIRDCYGVAANKSQICPFALLSKHVNLDYWENPKALKHYEHLVQKVFYGTLDYAAHANENLRLNRQEWNSCIWLANNGGGHRSAGLWAHYRRHNIPLLRMSEITSLAIHPDIYRACETHCFWLFSTNAKNCFDYGYYRPVLRSWSAFDAFGIKAVHIPYVGLEHTYCLGWRRDMPFAKITKFLIERGALNLSAAILNGFKDFVLLADDDPMRQECVLNTNFTGDLAAPAG